jgi:hypothetical protein
MTLILPLHYDVDRIIAKYATALGSTRDRKRKFYTSERWAWTRKYPPA